MGTTTSMQSKRLNNKDNSKEKARSQSTAASSPAVMLIDRKNSTLVRHTTGVDRLGRFIQITEEEFQDTLPTLAEIIEEETETLLKAMNVNFHVRENKIAHHTSDYDMSELILRRGQPFDLTVAFNRPYDESTDQVVLQFATGSRPKENKGTVVRVGVHDNPLEKIETEWEITMKKVHVNDYITYTVTTAPSAIVGTYYLSVETRHKTTKAEFTEMRHNIPEVAFYLIFNPWCPDDDVYMSSASERSEYVMNETGRMWFGTVNSQQAWPWNYGQFEEVTLKAAMDLLHKSDIADEACGNIVHITRTISAMANWNDNDGGVLMGRWNNNYPPGTVEPWAWSGSVEILKKFMENGQPVCYGQCWNFAGLVTSLMRALGVPTRSVTNYESAHDTDGSMTLDYHWDENDQPLLPLNDTIWNFHVWNESYFRRTDLPEGYDGWQVHDATPQQLSEGMRRCGPAPLVAIKLGQTYIPYDSGFVFSEVNGEKINWLVHSNGSMKPICYDTAAVGKCIKTKAIGSCRSVEITDLYKYKEGSEQERQAVKTAHTRSSRRMHLKVSTPRDVVFNLKVPHTVMVGSDLKLSVDVQNTSSDNKTTKICLTLVMTYYTGVPSERILTEHYEKQLLPKGESKLVVNVPYENYRHLLMREGLVSVFLMCTIPFQGQSFALMDTIRLLKPCLQVQVKPKQVLVDQEFELVISFTNSLPHTLNNCIFHIEAPGIVGPYILESRTLLLPKETLVERLKLSPKRAGKREIVVNLTTEMVPGIVGTTEVLVNDPPVEVMEFGTAQEEGDEKEVEIEPQRNHEVEL